MAGELGDQVLGSRRRRVGDEQVNGIGRSLGSRAGFVGCIVKGLGVGDDLVGTGRGVCLGFDDGPAQQCWIPASHCCPDLLGGFCSALVEPEPVLAGAECDLGGVHLSGDLGRHGPERPIELFASLRGHLHPEAMQHRRPRRTHAVETGRDPEGFKLIPAGDRILELPDGCRCDSAGGLERLGEHSRPLVQQGSGQLPRLKIHAAQVLDELERASFFLGQWPGDDDGGDLDEVGVVGHVHCAPAAGSKATVPRDDPVSALHVLAQDRLENTGSGDRRDQIT